MKRPLLLLPLLALAQDPATNAEGAFFLAALERAREIAAKAGAECHVRTLYSATRGREFERGTQLAAQLTIPNPSAAHPGDLEEEGVRLLPVLTERFAEAETATILACWFLSRAPLYDGRLLHPGGALPSSSKNPEWRMRILAGASDPAAGSKGVTGDLFYGRVNAHPFSRDDYRGGNEKEGLVRSWTDGTRYLVLVPTSARHENPVWDRLFATATNAVAREIGE